MSLKTGASVVALLATLGVSHAIAQTQTPPPAAKAPVSGQILVQEESTILAKDLIGQTVLEAEKTKIGTISDLILSKDGKNVEGFVIGVGGFLGIGEKAVALKLDRLKMTPEADGTLALLMDIKREELANAPTFKSKKEQIAEKEAAERARSRPAPGAPGLPPSKTN